MKKISLTLLVSVFFLFFVQLASAVVPAPETGQTITFVGKVRDVSSADYSIGRLPKIVISNEQGNMLSLEVKPDTVIFDKTGKAIALDKVKTGDKVTVEYIVKKEVVEKAESIKLTE